MYRLTFGGPSTVVRVDVPEGDPPLRHVPGTDIDGRRTC